MKACFNIYRGREFLQSFVLDKKQTSLGNLAGLDLVLPRSGSEECFLEVVFADGKFQLDCRRGHHQCRLNGQDFPANGCRLRIGDRLQVGDHLLVFDIAKAEVPASSEKTEARDTPGAVPSPLDETRDDLAYALRVLQQGRELRIKFLQKDKTFIGRMSENDLVLDDPLASRSHLLIERQGNSFWLRDQQSENGTLLNGLRVGQAQLKIGDIIRIGDHELHFLLTSRAAAAASGPHSAGDSAEEEWRLSRTLSLSAEEQQRLLRDIEHKRGCQSPAAALAAEPFPPRLAGLPQAELSGEDGDGEPEQLQICLRLGQLEIERSLEVRPLPAAAAATEDELELRFTLRGRVYSARLPLKS